MSKNLGKSYLFIRSSDGKTFYMKVAQNDETDPTESSVSVSGPSTEVNPQLLARFR